MDPVASGSGAEVALAVRAIGLSEVTDPCVGGLPTAPDCLALAMESYYYPRFLWVLEGRNLWIFGKGDRARKNRKTHVPALDNRRNLRCTNLTIKNS